MILNELFYDLVSVPGLQSVVLFDYDHPPTLHQIDETIKEVHSPIEQERFLRGVAQILRNLRGMVARIELRYTKGRFIVRGLPNGLTIVCITDSSVNLPLLEIALEAYAQAATQNPRGVADTFRASEISEIFADISSVKAVPINSTLRSLRSVQAELAKHAEANEETVSTELPLSPAFTSPHNFPQKIEIALPMPKVQNQPAALMSVGEVAEGLTEISDRTAQFLGRSVVANYWRQTQLESWKKLIEITMDGKLNALSPNQPLTFELWQAATEWAKKFVQRCSVIVVDIGKDIQPQLQGKGRILLSPAQETVEPQLQGVTG